MKERQRSLSITKKLSMALSALEGISDLHEEGVIHCDISLVNLMATDYKDGRAAVLDLGKAVFAKSRTTTGISPLLIQAPEVGGNEPYTNKIDVWPFAACIALFLCAPSTDSMRAGERATEPDCVQLQNFLIKLSVRKPYWRQTLELLMSMLNVDPADRSTSADALASPTWKAVWRAKERALQEGRDEMWEGDEPEYFRTWDKAPQSEGRQDFPRPSISGPGVPIGTACCKETSPVTWKVVRRVVLQMRALRM